MSTELRGSALPFIHPDDMPDQYALKAFGDCMAPLIADGSLLVFDKRERPARGDTVGLTFTPDVARRWGVPGLVKRLAFALPPLDLPSGCQAWVIVDQLNPPRQYRIPSADILATHKCVGTAELGKDGQAQFRPSQEPPRQPFATRH